MQIGTLKSEAITNSAVEHDALHGHGPECVEGNWPQACDGHVDLRRLAPDQPPRQLLSHGGSKRDATAVTAEIYQCARSRFVQMGIVIGSHGETAVPAVCPADPSKRRPQPGGVAHEISDRRWIIDPTHRTSSPHEQAVRRID